MPNLYSKPSAFQVGVEPQNNRNVHKVHEDCDDGEDNNPEKLREKSIPFGFEEPKDSPGFILWQTTITWQRLIKKALEPYDIAHAQFVIMALLLWGRAHVAMEGNNKTTQAFLVEYSKLDKMTVSKSLKKLISLGFVSRSENEADTRSKNVTLTEKGKDLVHKLVPIVEKIDADFFSPLSTEKQKTLINLLTAVCQN